MKKVNVDDLFYGKVSRYSLVIGVAKRAREIATALYEQNMVIPEKPVKTAVEEFACGKYRIVEAEKNK